MAKAKDDHTPAAKPLTDEEEARRFDAAFVNVKARKAIDRALAIQSGYIAPPWAKGLLDQLKRTPVPQSKKHRAQRQVDRVRRALQHLYPKGAPDEIPTASIHQEVVGYLKPETKTHHLADPSPTSVERALGRRK